MTQIQRSDSNRLDLIAEDIANAKRTLCAAVDHRNRMDVAEFMIAQRQLERALADLAEFRELFYIAELETAERNNVLTMAVAA